MNKAPANDSAADQFLIAIKENKPDTVKLLLSQNQVKPNNLLPLSIDYDSHGFPPAPDRNLTSLHAACYHGHPAIVEQLLIFGADPNACSKFNSTPLIYAAMNNLTDNIVNMLFKAGAKPNLKDLFLRSALHYASHRGNTQLMTQLINHDAMLDMLDDIGCTPLHEAVRSGSHEAVTLLLANNASVNSDRDYGLLLNFAVGTKKIELIICLIRAGFDPLGRSLLRIVEDISLKEQGSGPGRLFSEEEVYLIAETLLNCGFNPNFKCSYMRSTPLMAAVYAGRPEVISLLVDHGAKLTTPLESGKPLLALHSVTRRDEVKAMVNNLDPVTSLQSACRLTIRKALVAGRKPGESLISNTPLLPLPGPVKTYICNIPP